MSLTQLRPAENLLLASLARSDLALLEPHFTLTPLNLRDVLVHAGRTIEDVYFPQYGIASVVTTGADGRQLEVGIFGRDGMSAPSLLLGVDRTPEETFMQVEGAGLKMSAAVFSAALEQSPSLHHSLLKYVQAFSVQAAQTAVSNCAYKIEERLARWLLMCHDRLDTDNLSVTHEFLAMMLAVRRPGVTMAIQALAAAGVVRGERGRIVIVDRRGLQELASGSYGSPEAEYDRLIGPLRRGHAGGGGAGIEADQRRFSG